MSTSTQAEESLLLKIETSFISADLNSVILYVLLMGIYTMVFVWTLHLYINWKEKRNNIVTAALVGLYLINVANLGLEWQIIQQAVVDNGDTRTTIYETLQFSEGALQVASTTMQFSGYILADGLLIWRCYNIANRSILAICVPVFLFFCVIALSITAIVFFALFSFNPAALPALSTPALDLLAGGSIVNIVDATFSVLATFIIYRRISNSLRAEISDKGRYRRIMGIAIESAALYSLTGVILATVGIVNSCLTSENEIIITAVVINYLLLINFIVTGLAPTMMVAQICLSSGGKPETKASTGANPISALDFHHQPTVHSTLHITEAKRDESMTETSIKQEA